VTVDTSTLVLTQICNSITPRAATTATNLARPQLNREPGAARRQADAAAGRLDHVIAGHLREAGASKYESKAKNRQNLKRTKAREWRGVTARDTSERSGGQEATRSQLYAEGKRRNIPGRSEMSKNELERALR
jgi:hypothetical protein